MADDRDSTSGLTWFLAGAVCGAVVTLLYTPTTGPENRKLLSKKTDETRDALSDSGKEIVEKGKDLFERGRQVTKEAADLFDRAHKLTRG